MCCPCFHCMKLFLESAIHSADPRKAVLFYSCVLYLQYFVMPTWVALTAHYSICQGLGFSLIELLPSEHQCFRRTRVELDKKKAFMSWCDLLEWELHLVTWNWNIIILYDFTTPALWSKCKIRDLGVRKQYVGWKVWYRTVGSHERKFKLKAWMWPIGPWSHSKVYVEVCLDVLHTKWCVLQLMNSPICQKSERQF